MWMSNVVIVVNSKNADRNSLEDLADAVRQTGATAVMIDEQNRTIEAAVPADELPTVAAMEGVSYVRPVFNYYCNACTPARVA